MALQDAFLQGSRRSVQSAHHLGVVSVLQTSTIFVFLTIVHEIYTRKKKIFFFFFGFIGLTRLYS